MKIYKNTAKIKCAFLRPNEETSVTDETTGKNLSKCTTSYK